MDCFLKDFCHAHIGRHGNITMGKIHIQFTPIDDAPVQTVIDFYALPVSDILLTCIFSIEFIRAVVHIIQSN